MSSRGNALRQACASYLAFVQLASIRPWLRLNESASRLILIVPVTETSIVTRLRRPVSFDEIDGLGTRVGFAQNHRSVIAELTLADGKCWRVGNELIWLQPSASSEMPGLIKRLRKATGLAGDHAE